MSGGHFDYIDSHLANQLFGYNADPQYGMGNEDYLESLKEARKKNPLENKMLSELTFDVFCLLHSYDWYTSGDTDEDTYRKDVKYFMDKWLKISPNVVIRRTIDDCVEDLKDELIHNFGINGIGDLGWESDNLSNAEKIVKLQSDIAKLEIATRGALPDYRQVKEELRAIDSRLKELEDTVLWDEDHPASGTSWHRLGIQKLGLVSLYECPFCKKVIRFGVEPSRQCPVCGGDIKGYETPYRTVVFGKIDNEDACEACKITYEGGDK